MESSITDDILPTNNFVSAVSLTEKVKKVKNFVYFIECSSKGIDDYQKWSNQSSITSKIHESSKNSSSSNSITIKMGEQTKLYAGSSESIWWESDDPNIATITKDGLVKGISPGRAYIWAHIGDDMKLYFVVVLKK